MNSMPPMMNMNMIYSGSIGADVFNRPIKIGDFDILQQLGKGAHCPVYKVRYKFTNKIYAIKAFDQEQFKEQDKEIDYNREKTILYDLTRKNWPFIIKLYADFEDAYFRYLVMEFSEGTSLDKLRGNDNPGQYVNQNLVISIITQLLQTLEFLHNKCHIIHRDIKPDNINIDNNNNIKLLDFGLAVYLDNPNIKLVSRMSFKGAIRFVPPEVILFPKPLHYDYKFDIFSLGFTIYSLMNPKPNKKHNLPQETQGKNGNFQRIDQYTPNTFYADWLNQFVEILYTFDQAKRPTASEALQLLNQSMINPNMTANPINLNAKKKKTYIDNNMNPFFKPNSLAQNNNQAMQSNINNQIYSVMPNPIMSNSAQQIQNAMNINIDPSLNILLQGKNSLDKQSEVEVFLNPSMGKHNKILSSMKSLLQILFRLDSMNFIQTQLKLLFQNYQGNYNNLFINSFLDMLNNFHLLNNGQINNMTYNQKINDFIRLIFLKNNSGISGIRPIVLFYMMAFIFKDEFFDYFNNVYQNNIFDNAIQNNLFDFNIIVPMGNPTIFESLKNSIMDFKNNYKGPFVDNFYFIIMSVSRCPNCGELFGMRNRLATFLQLDVPNPQNNISQLIYDYFNPKVVHATNKYNCKCGSQGKANRRLYCLNLPNYLVIEFEDKNNINFGGDLKIPLFNGQDGAYLYFAGIYKCKNNDVSNYVTIIKNGNNYFLCNEDRIEQCQPNIINSDCPSLAIYKKISQ